MIGPWFKADYEAFKASMDALPAEQRDNVVAFALAYDCERYAQLVYAELGRAGGHPESCFLDWYDRLSEESIPESREDVIKLVHPGRV